METKIKESFDAYLMDINLQFGLMRHFNKICISKFLKSSRVCSSIKVVYLIKELGNVPQNTM